MNLYRIDFIHYGPKAYERGTWGFMLARDDAHLFAKLCHSSSPTCWGKDDTILVYDEKGNEEIDAPISDHYIEKHGNMWEEVEDAYYGATQWEWTWVKECPDGYQDPFVRELAHVGIFRETQWEGLTIAVMAAIGRWQDKGDYAIGLKGELPWKLSADLKRFKKLTSGDAIIMGRKTWESIPEKFRPLPDRQNIVLSSNPNYEAKGAQVATNLTDALIMVEPNRTAFVIGGKSVFKEALPFASQAHITWVLYEEAFDTKWQVHFSDAVWLWHIPGEEVPADDKNSHHSEYVYYSRLEPHTCKHGVPVEPGDCAHPSHRWEVSR